MVNKAVVVR